MKKTTGIFFRDHQNINFATNNHTFLKPENMKIAIVGASGAVGSRVSARIGRKKFSYG